MKIELWYDAVAQETDIIINGSAVGKNDIYGFLYPVRNYPLQSWIYPNGSWKGIEYQIVDLARDEEVNLIFHGRKCDYDDLNECLSVNGKIKLLFAEWDICGIYDKLFSNLLSTLKTNDNAIKELMSSLNLGYKYNADFNISADNSKWAYHIYDDLDLEKSNDIDNKCCCFIHSKYFTSYDKLQQLLCLTRSLNIPADAIYCCFDDERGKEDFKYYAQSFKRIVNFRFCLESEDYAKEAESKYGLPSIVKFKIVKCGELLKLLCDVYEKVKESTQQEFNKLKKNIVTLNQHEKEHYQVIKTLRGNIDKFRFGMEFVSKYIDILLSVSKANKEEVFHYECIDKLEENINLYLNIKSNSEVD